LDFFIARRQVVSRRKKVSVAYIFLARVFYSTMANPQRENGYTAISNEIMEALAKIRIAGEARQMLDVIIRKTYGFNKRQDTIPTFQFKKLTDLSNMAIHKAREKLNNMNLITITKKGNSQDLTYSFQKDYEKWKPLPKKVSVTQKGNRCYPKRLKTVTKKVYNIQKKENNIQKKEKFLEFVYLTNKEYEKLILAHGEPLIKEYISKLNNYIGSTGKRYKSHYHTLLNWLSKEPKQKVYEKL